MPQEPTPREQHLMHMLAFETREELVTWLDELDYPLDLERIEPVYPDDEPDLGADDPEYVRPTK